MLPLFTAICLALALMAPTAHQSHATPSARCTQGTLLAIATQPPTFAQCKDGRWRAISKRDYERLRAAQGRVRK